MAKRTSDFPFDRCTDRARKVIALANQEAQRFNHEYIGTEHILIGLVNEGAGVGATVLKGLGADLNNVRLEVGKFVTIGPDDVTMIKFPLTAGAERVFQYALEEARALDKNHVGTEHLLLGLVREQEGVAFEALSNLKLKSDDIREKVLDALDPHRKTHRSLLERWTTKKDELAMMLMSPPATIANRLSGKITEALSYGDLILLAFEGESEVQAIPKDFIRLPEPFYKWEFTDEQLLDRYILVRSCHGFMVPFLINEPPRSPST